LKSEGELAVSKRKWGAAQKAFEAVLRIDPRSKVARDGFELIRLGKLDERNQKIFYILGNSQAAMEAGRWDEAKRLAQSVLDENPDHQAALAKLREIEQLRRAKKLELMVAKVTVALESGQLSEAQQSLFQLKREDPAHARISELTERLNTAMRALQARQRKALALWKQAKALDHGQFSAEALRLLDEARQLDPVNPDIAALHEKMSNYTRTLQVPGDFPTIAQAVAAARPRDRVRVAAGVYQESITIDRSIRLEGAPGGKTILELPATQAPLVTITAEASGVHVSGFVLRHVGFDYSDERASIFIVQGGSATISGCSIIHAAGHGLAVIDGAKVKVTGCEVSQSGWDGISVYGQGSVAEIQSTISQKNLQQGVGFWKGGRGSVKQSRMLANGLCGVLAMSPGTQVSIQTTLCARNRGAGILISDQVRAEILANRCDQNILSGIVARGAGTSVSVINCIATGNQEVGILIYQGVQRIGFSNNTVKGNKRRQIWLDAPPPKADVRN
jgi:tetratricopeptide (TPR) repeat protein